MSKPINDSYKINKYKLLLLMPSLKCKGGVSDFCNMLYKNLVPNFYVDYLEVGAEEENENIIKKLYHLFHTIYELMRIIKNNRYQIAQLNPSFRVFALIRDSLYLYIINRINPRTKIVMFFHGWDLNLAEKIASNFLYKELFVHIYKRTAIIFVLYNKCKEQLIDIGIDPQKIEVTKTFYERIKIQDNNKDEKDKVNILFMSRFVKGKGVEISIEVAKLLLENGYTNFNLMLAGDGPLVSLAKDYVKKYELDAYVEFPGYVEGCNKARLLNNSDIFILPTKLQEGCPISVMEAMGSGLAVISTPMGGIPEIIKNGEDGFICDSQNTIDFYNTVKRLLDDKELLRKIQLNAKLKAEENFEVKVFMKKLEMDYLSIINTEVQAR